MGNTFNDATVAGASVGLCSREAVLARMGLVGTPTAAQVAEIDALIDTVAPTFARRYGREFLPRITATRTFSVRGRFVDLRGDLVSATSVTINPEADATVLAPGIGYVAILNDLSGTATHIRLASDVDLCSDHRSRFGTTQLAIAGTWGIWADTADVAPDVAEAAVQTVVSWLDRGASNVSGIDLGDPRAVSAPVATTWDIPSSAHRKMQAWAVSDLMGTW